MTVPAAVRARPILFSGPMVSAILDGSKTQTRRVISDQPLRHAAGKYAPADPFLHGDGITWGWMCGVVSYTDHDRRCPYGKSGDRLWVRESWRLGANLDALSWSKIAAGRLGRIEYPATPDTIPWANRGRVRSARFMPRRLSRITLELTDVRVERLEKINHEDVLAEGIDRCNSSSVIMARERYQLLWNSLNSKRGYGWESNPWVWVLSLRRVEQQAVAA